MIYKCCEKTNIYKEFPLYNFMFDKNNFRDMITLVLILGLFILAGIIIRPIIFAIILGVLLAYILYPFYNWVLKKLKNEFLSALLVCSILLVVIFGLTGLILSALVNQAINLYFTLQNINLSEVLIKILPHFLSNELSSTIAGSLNTFISKALAYSLSKSGDFILNLPVILLKLFVAIFIFFFALKDGKKAIEYIKSLDLLEKENQEKFFVQFKNITYSVLVGQIVVGIIQGFIAGIGYFIFGVPNALLLTFFTMLVAIIPFIGAWLGWVPVVVYLFSLGRTGAAIGLLIYGLLIVSIIDNILRTVIISRKTKINSSIIIIGMIGGLFVFDIFGLIIGPLVLAYVLLVLEIYRKKNFKGDSIIFKEDA